MRIKELDRKRYICEYKGGYHIQKWVNGKLEYFGRFPTFEDAIRERTFLESIDWDCIIPLPHEKEKEED